MIGSDGHLGRLGAVVRGFRAPPADDLVWPVVLQFGEADGLALLEAETGDLQLLGPGGARYLWDCNGVPLDTRRPFGATRGVKTVKVPTLVASEDSLFVSSSTTAPRRFYDPSPLTYPLKFPDDPPGP